MTLGERIKWSRQNMGLSQRKLAVMLGIRFQTVQAWESGRAQPKGSRTPEVAIALDVSVEWLLTGKGNMRVTQLEPTELTTEEIAMLKQFRALPAEKRKTIKSVVDAMV